MWQIPGVEAEIAIDAGKRGGRVERSSIWVAVDPRVLEVRLKRRQLSVNSAVAAQSDGVFIMNSTR